MGKRWYVAILTVLAIMVFAYHPTPANAQSKPCGINYTWLNVVGTPDYVSFQETDFISTIFYPSSRDDNSFVESDKFLMNQWYWVAQTYATTWQCTPRSVQMIWSRANTNSAQAKIETSDDGITWTQRAYQELNAGGVANTNITLTWTNTTNITYRYVRTSARSSKPYIRSFYIDSDPAEETQLIRPLLGDDEVSLTMPQDEPYYANYVMSVSDEAGKPVHAPADSVVMGITRLTEEQCEILGLYLCFANNYPLDISRAYVVSIRTLEGDEMLYVMDNAPNYVKNESTITGGCIMGVTIRTNNPVGVMVVSDNTEYLIDRFTLAPSSEAEPCVGGETDLVCEGGDSRLNTIFIASQKTAGVVLDGSSIVIPPGGRMFGVLALPQNERIYAEIIASGQSAIAQFGTRVETVSLTDQLNTITFGWSYITPDNGEFSTISLTNTGAVTLTISDICVALESKNDPNDPDNPNPPDLPPTPSDCYFYNHSFDLGDAGWQINATDYNAISKGILSVSDGATIGQNVSLYPEGVVIGGEDPIYAPANYDLIIEISVWHNGWDYDPMTGGDVVEIYYNFGSSSGYFEITNFFDQLSYERLNEFYILSQPIRLGVLIEVTEPIQDNLTITFDLGETPPDGIRGLNFHSVCLSPIDDVWHGYEPDGNGKEWLESDCPDPAPLGVGATIAQLGNFMYASMDSFLRCTLMRATNGIYAQTRNATYGATFAGDWFGEQFTPYLGGHLSNMFNFGSSVNFDPTIFTEGFAIFEGLPTDIFGLGVWVVANFFNMLGRIISNLGTIISAVVEFFQTLINIANELISAWNNTIAQTMPGIDDCQIAPETKSRCVIFWVMENTILGQPYGHLIIPLITSAMTVIVLGWLFIKVRALIERVTGQTS